MAVSNRIRNNFGGHNIILLRRSAFLKIRRLLKKEAIKKNYSPTPNKQQPRTPVETLAPSVRYAKACSLIDLDSSDDKDNDNPGCVVVRKSLQIAGTHSPPIVGDSVQS